jgi:hypothetical protein
MRQSSLAFFGERRKQHAAALLQFRPVERQDIAAALRQVALAVEHIIGRRRCVRSPCRPDARKQCPDQSLFHADEFVVHGLVAVVIVGTDGAQLQSAFEQRQHFIAGGFQGKFPANRYKRRCAMWTLSTPAALAFCAAVAVMVALLAFALGP